MRSAAAVAVALILAGCGGSPEDDAFRPGTPVVVSAVPSELPNEAGSHARDGRVTVILEGPEGFATLPDATRGIALDDPSAATGGGGRAIRVRIDEGEYRGKVGKVARFMLTRVGG